MCYHALKDGYDLYFRPGTTGPYLGFFVCGGKLHKPSHAGISRIHTGFLVKHYVRKKLKFVFLAGETAPPPPPPLCTALNKGKQERCAHLASEESQRTAWQGSLQKSPFSSRYHRMWHYIAPLWSWQEEIWECTKLQRTSLCLQLSFWCFRRCYCRWKSTCITFWWWKTCKQDASYWSTKIYSVYGTCRI